MCGENENVCNPKTCEFNTIINDFTINELKDDVIGIFLTNDLVMRFFRFLMLCQKHNNIPSKDELLKLFSLLFETYDEDQGTRCCTFWHSVSKDALINICEPIFSEFQVDFPVSV